jgi:hypothetical protein
MSLWLRTPASAKEQSRFDRRHRAASARETLGQSFGDFAMRRNPNAGSIDAGAPAIS